MRILIWLAVLGATAALAAVLITQFGPRAGRERARRQFAARLDSPDSEVRKQAAWDAMRLDDQALELSLAQRLTSGEPDEGVREACAYALGHASSGAAAPALELAVDLDESGFVRAAAWLALARTDADRFLACAARHGDRDALWDRLGIAQGRLWLGDVSDLAIVFDAALRGEDLQRWVATRAIQRSVRPLLDSVGRWPLGQSADKWPAGSVEKIRIACAEVDMAAVARDCRAPLAAAQDVRQYVRKLASASDRIGRWLIRGTASAQEIP